MNSDRTRFTAHHDTSGSAVLAIINSSPTLIESYFQHNSFLSSVVHASETSNPSFLRCAFDSNRAVSSTPSAALLMDGYGHCVVQDSSFSNNLSPGGAALMVGALASIHLERTLFDSNNSTMSGVTHLQSLHFYFVYRWSIDDQ